MSILDMFIIYLCITLSILPLTILVGIFCRVYYKMYIMLFAGAILWPLTLLVLLGLIVYRGGKMLLGFLWRAF